jgi:hypothetical protein
MIQVVIMTISTQEKALPVSYRLAVPSYLHKPIDPGRFRPGRFRPGRFRQVMRPRGRPWPLPREAPPGGG